MSQGLEPEPGDRVRRSGAVWAPFQAVGVGLVVAVGSIVDGFALLFGTWSTAEDMDEPVGFWFGGFSALAEGLLIFGFVGLVVFPIVGLLVGLVVADQRARRARAAGEGALEEEERSLPWPGVGAGLALVAAFLTIFLGGALGSGVAVWFGFVGMFAGPLIGALVGLFVGLIVQERRLERREQSEPTGTTAAHSH